MSKQLYKDTARGLQWTMIAQVIRYPFQVVFSIILANYISPEEFGLIGMVTVFVGLANIFFDLGFASALIRNKTVSGTLLNSVFWTTLIMSAILCLVFVGIAKPISLLYDEPRLTMITMAISVTFILKALTVIPESLLSRSLNFKPLALRDLAAFFSSYIVSIILAIAGMGVWSIIIQQYLQVGISIVLLFMTVNWKPKFEFSVQEIKNNWKYGSNLTGFSLLNYGIRNLDNFLVGKFLGSAALGIYSRGYVFITSPVSQVSRVFSKVMFPSLSRAQDDLITFRKMYIATCQVISLAVFPLMVLVGVTADQFVVLFLGDEWKELIPIIRIFAFLGAYQAIGTTVGWIYTSHGRTDIMFKWSIYASIVTVASFILGVYIGSPLAVAACYAVANVCFIMIPSFYIPFKIIDLKLGGFIKELRHIILINLALLGVCLVISFALDPFINDFVLFAITVTSGTLFYFLMIIYFKVPIVAQLVVKYASKFPFLIKLLSR